MTLTQFWDMHSGGGQKLDWSKIYIEAPEEKACEVFERMFGREPNHVTCSCCGEDYSVCEYDSLIAATEYHRQVYNQPERSHISLADYMANPNVRIIHAAEIEALK